MTITGHNLPGATQAAFTAPAISAGNRAVT